MWGGGGGSRGMINEEDKQQSNCRIGKWQREQKNMNNKNGYGRWSMWTILAVGDTIVMNQRVLETNNLRVNRMDYFVFFHTEK